MKSKLLLTSFITMIIASLFSCSNSEKDSELNILFLHHSTGRIIWNGGAESLLSRATERLSGRLSDFVSPKSALPKLFADYNKDNNKKYSIEELNFPKETPYGWKNYPFDYYNIWVKNAGEEPYLEEPTLEILTKDYQVIIFKHCFPVSNIQPDDTTFNIDSEAKTLANYKLQYLALREKLQEFPETRFILFTGAAQVQGAISVEEARRTQEFFKWVVEEWDLKGDNIHLWDLYSLQTNGGLFLNPAYAVSQRDSHPNNGFAKKVVSLLFSRIVDVIENDGRNTTITGEPI